METNITAFIQFTYIINIYIYIYIHTIYVNCMQAVIYIYIYIYINKSTDFHIKSFWYNCILKLCGRAYGKYTFWVSNQMVGSATKIANDIAFSNKGQS